MKPPPRKNLTWNLRFLLSSMVQKGQFENWLFETHCACYSLPKVETTFSGPDRQNTKNYVEFS